jgi:multicomponent Na+:H+ antiporter subunit G
MTTGDVFVLALAWIGAGFISLAAIGVLRMPDVFSRLQAASKAATLGVACLVLAMALHFGTGSLWFRAGALIVFLFLTVPIAAHLIARAAFVTDAPLAAETVIDESRELLALEPPQRGRT